MFFVEVEAEIQRARSNLEANKDSLLKVISKEDHARRMEAKKKDAEQKKLMNALEKSGIF